MNPTSKMISRRTMLRGPGVALALPYLPSLMPRQARAAAPKRLVFLYVPNGIIMDKWTPTAVGPWGSLPPTLQPLEDLRDHFIAISGLDQPAGEARGDGPGDHARASASYLTSQHPVKSATNVRAGISVDQVAAQALGHLTRLPSLELICDRGQQAGACDSGYGCAYQTTLSWRSETTPIPPEVDPRLVFERLFGPPASGREERSRARERVEARKSVLDYVGAEVARKLVHLGADDRRKLDEYATSVREVERQLQTTEKMPTPAAPTGVRRPLVFPANYQDHLQVMTELLVLALQTDSTRIATLLFSREISNRTFPALGSFDGHHDLSHHSGKAHKIEMLEKIDRFHVGELARVVRRLKACKDGDQMLLDSVMLVYGSGLSDGNRHLHTNLPTLLFGQRSNQIRPGRHIQVAPGTRMSNLWLSLLHRMGLPHQTFADSTGTIAELG